MMIMIRQVAMKKMDPASLDRQSEVALEEVACWETAQSATMSIERVDVEVSNVVVLCKASLQFLSGSV